MLKRNKKEGKDGEKFKRKMKEKELKERNI